VAETSTERQLREMAERHFRQQQADQKQQETARNDRARQYQRDKDTAAFTATLTRNARTAPLPPRDPPVSYPTGSYQSGGSRSSGSGIPIVIGIILTVLCVYAVAHGVSLLAIGKVAILGAAALAAIAILIAVLTFIRNHFLGIVVIAGAAIYAWVHFYGYPG
jgi:Flp pilus assembly protein TadB